MPDKSMMKPDTPKFAEMPETIYACVTEDGQMWTGSQQLSGAFATDFPMTKYIRADLAAAPKPDCVGVEEIRNSVYKMAFGGNIDEDSDGDYIHVIDEVIDALKTLGLLAVKEKAQEGNEKQCP